MKKTGLLRKLIFLVAFVFITFCSFGSSLYRNDINWPTYMAQHDLIWEEMPLQWNEGAFVGNGQLGMMIYVNAKNNQIVFHLGRQDVTDHRLAPNQKSSLGVKGARVVYEFPRLDIGKMLLAPKGKIISGTFRQDLWNAEVTGTVLTDSGVIQIKAYTHRDRMVNVVEVKSTEKSYYNWSFKAGNPASPRAQVFPDAQETKSYVTNPKPNVSTHGKVSACVQTLLAGGDYATAWMEEPVKGQMASTLFISTANEVPVLGKSVVVATDYVKKAASTKSGVLENEHRNWWHNYFQQSFISIPDGQMESFYWIQIYKIASSSRPDGPAIDLFGPYFRISQWPGLWWNLNVQLTYWPVYASNHLEMGENLINLIDERFEGLLRTYSSPKLGDFGWAMHNYWLQYRYAGDWKSIQTKWMPKAKQIVEAYEKFQITDSLGRIQLAPMGSPEYHEAATFPNTNYNLAILRWLLNSLIETNERAGSNARDVAKWKKTLAALIAYPVDENGLMIASNQSLDMSHRHYSHLLGLYPLFQLNPDSPTDRALVEKSVLHWHGIQNGKALCGYSFTGAGSLYAALGNGNDAYEILQKFLNDKIGMSMLTSNTFYLESKGKNPVIETPLSCAASTMELLLQSWGGKIRVFPAIPEKWDVTSFQQLRAQGGFLVSASRKDFKTEWICVKSLAGEPCVIKTNDWSQAVQLKGNRNFNITTLGKGEFAVDLKAGEEIMLSSSSELTEASLIPCLHPDVEKNNYGVKKGKSLPEILEWKLPEYEY